MKKKEDIIEDILLKELPYFEQFFLKVGMKRIDGAIYGLLTLSLRALTSEEIERTLNLSQSAISTSLSNLTNIGAIESLPGKERRLMRHHAKTDTLQAVATIFKIREQEAISSFKQMATKIHSMDITPNENRRKRLESIIEISNLAESVVELVIEIAKLSHLDNYKNILKSLPKGIKMLKKSSHLIESSDHIIKSMTSKFEKSFNHFINHGANE